jgi:2-polyprenyl-6-hydroxyphenyl methylase / 3-demethylubiquinone-9 3-methyltransferase
MPATAARPASTAQADEVARFTAMAEAWWDPRGEFKPLHAINALRLAILRRHLLAYFGRDGASIRPFSGLRLLDIGCGGGLMAEPLTRLGFAVTAIDAGAENIAIARAHAESLGLAIDYRVATPEELADQPFDAVVSLEVVEHVPDIGAFLAAAGAHLRSGGFFAGATLNRTPRAYALAVVAAERLLRWLPAGTHDWRKFVRPSEFAAALRPAGIDVAALAGLSYAPMTGEWRETADLGVNYLLFGTKR